VDSAGRHRWSVVLLGVPTQAAVQVSSPVRPLGALPGVAGLANVETHVSDAYHLPLDDESVDRAFLVTVLPEIPNRQRALAELRRVLRSPKPAEGKLGGVLSITEEFLDPDYPPTATSTSSSLHCRPTGWHRWSSCGWTMWCASRLY
jgi:hypothetical protein